jgi:hypothetical protein
MFPFMFIKLVCETCGSRYERTPAVAKKSRFCSAPCRIAAVAAGNTRPLSERFWEKVKRSGRNTCWPWVGGCFADGYGAINVDGKPQRAPRVSYELKNGPIPEGLHIRHSCDNPKCVNPRHLLTGTPSQNAADKVARGRQSRNFKITDQQVQEIRESTETYEVLTKRYKVSVGLIGLIRGKAGHRVARPVKVSRRKEMAGKI